MHITESQKKESGANPTRESVDEISVGAMEIILLSLSARRLKGTRTRPVGESVKAKAAVACSTGMPLCVPKPSLQALETM